MPKTVKFQGDDREYLITSPHEVLAAVDGNHIWLNAFSCVDPTDAFALMVGRQVLEMLNHKENLIPAPLDPNDLQVMSPAARAAMVDIGALTPQLYLRINKS